MSLLERYARAARSCGRPMAALLMEAARLRLGHTRLGVTEYLDFRLFAPDLSWEEKLAYAGQRAQAVLEDMLIDEHSLILSKDKVTMYGLMQGVGLPIPMIRAVYRSRRPGRYRSLQTPAELAEYLSQPANLPVYIKRSFGSYGRGNLLVRSCDGERVVLGNGATEPLAAFCEALDDGRSLGWILQEPLAPHPQIAELTGATKVSGARLHTFLSHDDVHVVKAIFKVNVGQRDSDNFEHGASGNLLGAVDIATGCVTRAIAGVGPDQVENPRHPVSGRELAGFQLPHWSAVVGLVRDAQKAFPGFLCPGWDVALCADGPRILEVNCFGDVDLSQHAHRVGFLDPAFLALLRGRGLEHLLRKPPRPRRRSPHNHRLGIRKHHWPW